MNITFIGQGFNAKSNVSVGSLIIDYLRDGSFKNFTLISAFASEAAVYGLSEVIKQVEENYDSILFIVGVDLNGTSKEALEEILELDIDSYVFYQHESPIFHPKIYLFEGDEKIKLIIGSSNLTGAGLFTNVESSVLIEFAANDETGISLLNDLKTHYETLFDQSDPNVFELNEELIEDFELRGIIPNEATRRRLYRKLEEEPEDETDTGEYTPAIDIPKRSAFRVPNDFPKKRYATASRAQRAEAAEPVTALRSTTMVDLSELSPIWISGSLTERDLNIPRGSNTNATGSMLFKKGKTEGIDQRHYFREDVFKELPWVEDANNPHLETATAFFQIRIDGETQGNFPLIISHNNNTESKTYLQNNSMTALRWGGAKGIIANASLIGKSANLYRNPEGDSNSYILSIQ